MKWNSKDLKQYIEAKEYIDTLLIPLAPLDLSDKNAQKHAFQHEVIAIYANEVEKQLMGRMLLLPQYLYIKQDDIKVEIDRLNGWINHCGRELFSHVFLLTFDVAWRKYEKDLDATLLWFPGIQTGNIASKEFSQMLSSQVSEIVELIRSYWEK